MKIRLLAPTQIKGRLHSAGEIVEVPNDFKGPMKAVRAGYDTDGKLGSGQTLGQIVDVPLFEKVS